MKKYFQQLVLALSICFLLPQPAKGLGNDNPTGVTGEYNGSITTGGSYDPYTGNAKRFVDDLAVAGSVGAYPLTWTRILNTRGGQGVRFGHGGTWRHSYQWGLWLRPGHPPSGGEGQYEGPDGAVLYPDGRRIDLRLETDGSYVQANSWQPLVRIQHVGNVGSGNYDVLLQDGGRVKFQHAAGSTSTYDLAPTEIVDPFGQTTFLGRDSAGRLSTITEPGGRYLKINYFTYSYYRSWPYPGQTHYVTVIDNVQAFSGLGGQPMETVFYHYTREDVPPQEFYNLTQVNYDDGTHATYTYYPSSTATYVAGRIHTCDDVRFAGPMSRIEYDYVTEGPHDVGQIKREKNLTTHQVVSEAIYPLWHYPPENPADFKRTEKRGDGSTRFFQYNNGNNWNAELQSYTDFKGKLSRIDYEGSAYRMILIDALEKRTLVEKESVVGAVMAVTHHDGSSIGYTYSESANPYYLASKSDERAAYPGDPQHTIFYDRDGANRISQTRYPDGGVEEFTYTPLGQIETHTMTSGGTETFEYDARGLKRKYWPPKTCDGIVCSDPDPWNHPTVYTYYDGTEGRLDRIDRLKSVTDPLEHTTSYDYNARGQVTKVTYPGNKFTQNGYNPLPDGTRTGPDGTLAWTEDELGHRTKYEYDEYKRVTRVTNHLGQSTANDYNPGLDPGNDRSLTHTTSSVYRTTSFMGKVTEYDYDENFRRTRTTQAPGMPDDEATTTSTYDWVGNLETVTEPNAQPAGAHTTYEYDGRNRRKNMTDALNHKTEWEYDGAGNMKKELRPDQKYRTWDLYDEMNRIKQTKGFLNEPTNYTYDLAGNMTMMTDSKGAQYASAYDELNRKKSATYPIDATNAVRTETWLYDIAGNLKIYKNPAGQFKHFEYDERNRQRRAYWNLLESDANANRSVGAETETVVDDANRVTEIKTNGGETIVAYEYDAANRKIWEDQTVSGLPTRRVQTDPDNDGNRATLSVAGVYSLTYDYTQRQQLWHINTGGNQFFEYGYDKNGNLKKRHNQLQGTDSTNFEYDELNRVTLCEQFQKEGVSFARSNYNDYDLLNNLKSISRAEDGNKGERFEYDDANQLRSASYNVVIGAPPPTPPPGQTPTPTPPPPGQTPTPTATAPPAQAAPVEFNEEEQANGTIRVSMSTGTAGATIFYTVGITPQYATTPTHDANGNPTGNTQRYSTPVGVGNNSILYFKALAYLSGRTDSNVTEYAVDNRDPGPDAAAPGPRTVTYNNDPLNRTSMNDNGTETVYGPPSGVNQYTSVTGHVLTYDANFNLSGYDGTYAYDADKRLISVGGGHSAQFIYDGLGRCVKRTIDNVTTVITYDGWKPVAEWNGAGGLVAWNLYGPGADEVLVRYQANTYLYYHLDAMGHVQFLLDGNGVVVEKYTYDAFGQPKITSGTGSARVTSAYENRFMFTGREYLSALGIYDYRHRVYHPGLGRFLQVDPIGFKGDATNLYRYCHNDPVNSSDPMGLWVDRTWDRLMYEQGGSQRSFAVEEKIKSLHSDGYVTVAQMLIAERNESASTPGKQSRNLGGSKLDTLGNEMAKLAFNTGPANLEQISYLFEKNATPGAYIASVPIAGGGPEQVKGEGPRLTSLALPNFMPRGYHYVGFSYSHVQPDKVIPLKDRERAWKYRLDAYLAVPQPGNGFSRMPKVVEPYHYDPNVFPTY